jgi:hypothetical protein
LDGLGFRLVHRAHVFEPKPAHPHHLDEDPHPTPSSPAFVVAAVAVAVEAVSTEVAVEVAVEVAEVAVLEAVEVETAVVILVAALALGQAANLIHLLPRESTGQCEMESPCCLRDLPLSVGPTTLRTDDPLNGPLPTHEIQ